MSRTEVLAYAWSERGRRQHIVRGEMDYEPPRLVSHSHTARCGYRPKWGWVEADTVERPEMHGCPRCYERAGLR